MPSGTPSLKSACALEGGRGQVGALPARPGQRVRRHGASGPGRRWSRPGSRPRRPAPPRRCCPRAKPTATPMANSRPRLWKIASPAAAMKGDVEQVGLAQPQQQARHRQDRDRQHQGAAERLQRADGRDATSSWRLPVRAARGSASAHAPRRREVAAERRARPGRGTASRVRVRISGLELGDHGRRGRTAR